MYNSAPLLLYMAYFNLKKYYKKVDHILWILGPQRSSHSLTSKQSTLALLGQPCTSGHKKKRYIDMYICSKAVFPH